MNQKKSPKYFSQAGIADVLGMPAYSVRYVIRTRHVEAALTVGNRRLFDKDALQEIRQFLLEISWRNRRSNHAAVTV